MKCFSAVGLVLLCLYYQHENIPPPFRRFKGDERLSGETQICTPLTRKRAATLCPARSAIYHHTANTQGCDNKWYGSEPPSFEVVYSVALFKWRLIHIQFLGYTIPPIYICHCINCKKIHAGAKSLPQSRHKTVSSPPKFLHSFWQAFPSSTLSPCQSLICLSLQSCLFQLLCK